MKNIATYLLAALILAACQNDDTDFSRYINGGGGDTETDTPSSTTGDISTITIQYQGSEVSVTGDDRGYVSVVGADVTIDTGTDGDSLLLVLSGSTTGGSLLVLRSVRYGLLLNGVTRH